MTTAVVAPVSVMCTGLRPYQPWRRSTAHPLNQHEVEAVKRPPTIWEPELYLGGALAMAIGILRRAPLFRWPTRQLSPLAAKSASRASPIRGAGAE